MNEEQVNGKTNKQKNRKKKKKGFLYFNKKLKINGKKTKTKKTKLKNLKKNNNY